jgi:DNA-binding NarL/FixJ family response regulator
MTRRQRVLVVEDEAFVREAMVEFIGAALGFEVVGTAATFREARQLLAELAPDIMVADLVLEDGNTMELLRLIREERRETKVVVLTGLRDSFAASEALAAGASGYVLKAQSARDLIGAIETVAMGRRYVSPLITVRLDLARSDGRGPSGLALLSRRELEILRLVAAGRTSAEIARSLNISTKTIDTHRSNMYRKLSLRNSVDLVRFASLHGVGLTAPTETPVNGPAAVLAAGGPRTPGTASRGPDPD